VAEHRGAWARGEAIQNFRQRVKARESSDGDILDGSGEPYGRSSRKNPERGQKVDNEAAEKVRKEAKS
jgi:hypothetical protein